MEDLQTRFETAAEAAKNLPSKPSNDTLLKIYGLYKQATVGDINTSKLLQTVTILIQIEKPGLLDQKGRAKWSAWEKLKGKTQDEAKTEYADLVESLK